MDTAQEALELDGASEAADWRAAASGLPLADFECAHGRLGRCDLCEATP